MARDIDLWITCGSTYTYLALMDLAGAERAIDVRFKVRPFYLGAIFKEAGYFPFPEDAAKTAYMWRDIERRAQARGLAPKLPAPYPAPNVVLANQIAHLALQHSWGRDYLVASYRAWFEHGLMPGEPENRDESFARVGVNGETFLTEEALGKAHTALVSETETAKEAGVFGAPTFAVAGELFWGADKMEEAVEWLDRSTA